MISFEEKERIFHIKTEKFSYVMQVLEHNILVNCYFGKKVNKYSKSNKIAYLDRAFSPNPTSNNRTFSLDTLMLEYSNNGLGDFRTSSIEVTGEHGSSIDLKYKGHRIFQVSQNYKAYQQVMLKIIKWKHWKLIFTTNWQTSLLP